MTLHGNFHKCGTRFYPVRSGAVRYKVLVMAFSRTRITRDQAAYCNIYKQVPLGGRQCAAPQSLC